jgi:hypothetical protein
MPTIQQWQKIGILGGLAVFVCAFGGWMFYMDSGGCDHGRAVSDSAYERCLDRQLDLANRTLTNYDRAGAERLCAGER